MICYPERVRSETDLGANAMANPSLFRTLGSMLVRLLIGGSITVVAQFSILLGALGTSSEARALIMISWFVGFASAAWVLLPAVRFSAFTALLSAIVWFWLGWFASSFGNPSVRGYPTPAWAVASFIFLFFIVIRPPHYLTAIFRRSAFDPKSSGK